MKSIIHARSEDHIRNGSFILERRGKKKSVFSSYHNGDLCNSNVANPILWDCKEWTLKEAKKLMPKGIQ